MIGVERVAVNVAAFHREFCSELLDNSGLAVVTRSALRAQPVQRRISLTAWRLHGNEMINRGGWLNAVLFETGLAERI